MTYLDKETRPLILEMLAEPIRLEGSEIVGVGLADLEDPGEMVNWSGFLEHEFRVIDGTEYVLKLLNSNDPAQAGQSRYDLNLARWGILIGHCGRRQYDDFGKRKDIPAGDTLNALEIITKYTELLPHIQTVQTHAFPTTCTLEQMRQMPYELQLWMYMDYRTGATLVPLAERMAGIVATLAGGRLLQEEVGLLDRFSREFEEDLAQRLEGSEVDIVGLADKDLPRCPFSRYLKTNYTMSAMPAAMRGLLPLLNGNNLDAAIKEYAETMPNKPGREELARLMKQLIDPNNPKESVESWLKEMENNPDGYGWRRTIKYFQTLNEKLYQPDSVIAPAS